MQFLKINAITNAINNIEIDTTIIESQLSLISITTFFVNVDPICTPNSTIPNSLSKNGHLISSFKTFTQMIAAIIGPNINGSNTCDEYNIILIKMIKRTQWNYFYISLSCFPLLSIKIKWLNCCLSFTFVKITISASSFDYKAYMDFHYQVAAHAWYTFKRAWTKFRLSICPYIYFTIRLKAVSNAWIVFQYLLSCVP